ncbi:MAG: acyltransferase [Acidimicrobiales bacterium]
MTPDLVQTLLSQPRIYGPPERLRIAATAVVNDSLFNLSSGEITVGEWSMLAHGVTVLTGVHDITKLGAERQRAVPHKGRDVLIEEGAWLASNVTVIGPCRIGAHAVVAAGSLVRHDVAPYAVVAGVPARVVGEVPHPALKS